MSNTAPTADPRSLPTIIAGPILRRATPERLVIWLASTTPLDLRLCLYRCGSETPFLTQAIGGASLHRLRIGEHAFVQLIDLRPEQPLPTDQVLEYDLRCAGPSGDVGLRELLPGILYPHACRPSLVIRMRLDDLVHGSCRKPHHPGPDALPLLDGLIEANTADPDGRPALLLIADLVADAVAADLGPNRAHRKGCS